MIPYMHIKEMAKKLDVITKISSVFNEKRFCWVFLPFAVLQENDLSLLWVISWAGSLGWFLLLWAPETRIKAHHELALWRKADYEVWLATELVCCCERVSGDPLRLLISIFKTRRGAYGTFRNHSERLLLACHLDRNLLAKLMMSTYNEWLRNERVN